MTTRLEYLSLKRKLDTLSREDPKAETILDRLQELEMIMDQHQQEINTKLKERRNKRVKNSKIIKSK
jgi:hypothetical protein